MHSVTVDRYAAASDFFVGVVAAVPPERYGEPWTVEWSVLDLIGHGNRAHTVVVEYLEHPVDGMPPGYLDPVAQTERTRQAVAVLSTDPVASVRECAERTRGMIVDASDDATVGTPFGTMPLDDYLPSRAAELVLHGLDLGTGVAASEDVLRGCLDFLADRVIARGDGALVARALGGRAILPADYSLY